VHKKWLKEGQVLRLLSCFNVAKNAPKDKIKGKSEGEREREKQVQLLLGIQAGRSGEGQRSAHTWPVLTGL